MAINLNLSNQSVAPIYTGGDRPAAQQSRSDSTDTSTRFVALSDQAQSLSPSQNLNDSDALDLVENKPMTPATETKTTERRINTLEQQQTNIKGEQQDLQDESERIEQQIRGLEQQERTIDQRLNRLRQSQSLGLIIDLRA